MNLVRVMIHLDAVIKIVILNRSHGEKNVVLIIYHLVIDSNSQLYLCKLIFLIVVNYNRSRDPMI